MTIWAVYNDISVIIITNIFNVSNSSRARCSRRAAKNILVSVVVETRGISTVIVVSCSCWDE